MFSLLTQKQESLEDDDALKWISSGNIEQTGKQVLLYKLAFHMHNP